TTMYPPEDPNYKPTASVRSMFMDRIGLAEARTIVDTLATSDAMFRAVQIRVLGGAIARVPADATAYAHRKAPIMLNLVAFFTTPTDKLKRDAWVEDFVAMLTQE